MNSKKVTSHIQLRYSIVFILLPLITLSQESFNDDTLDVPDVPINENIIPIMLLCIYFVFRFFNSENFNKNQKIK